MFYLKPPRHISTLPIASVWQCPPYFRFAHESSTFIVRAGMSQTCQERT